MTVATPPPPVPRQKVRGPEPRGLISPISRDRAPTRAARVALFGLLVVAAVSSFFPLYWLVTAAVKPPLELIQFPPTMWPHRWDLSTFHQAWVQAGFQNYFLNSVVLSGGLLVFRVGGSILAGYALSKLDVPARRVIMFVILTMLMIPGITYFVPQYLVVSDVPVVNVSLINTWWAVWLPHMASPITIYLLKNFFDQIPSELTESAAIDGAGSLRTLFSVVLPMSKPVLAVVTIYTITSGWKEFLWPLLVLPDQSMWPVEVALYRIAERNIPINVQMAILVLATLPMIAIFLAFQRHIMKGVAVAGIKN